MGTVGLEPTRLAAQAPKASASANSATSPYSIGGNYTRRPSIRQAGIRSATIGQE